MSGLGGTGPVYLSAAAKDPAVNRPVTTNAKAILRRIVNLFSRFSVALCRAAPGGADLVGEVIRVCGLIEDRNAVAFGRQEYHALAVSFIQTDLLAVRDAEPASVVVRVRE